MTGMVIAFFMRMGTQRKLVLLTMLVDIHIIEWKEVIKDMATTTINGHVGSALKREAEAFLVILV